MTIKSIVLVLVAGTGLAAAGCTAFWKNLTAAPAATSSGGGSSGQQEAAPEPGASEEGTAEGSAPEPEPSQEAEPQPEASAAAEPAAEAAPAACNGDGARVDSPDECCSGKRLATSTNGKLTCCSHADPYGGDCYQ